ncbi:MAG: hypothetical protein R3F59_31545 [Myxococcota bacterium]
MWMAMAWGLACDAATGPGSGADLEARYLSWLDPTGSSLRIDLIDDAFARALDQRPIDIPTLPSSPAEGRTGGIVEAFASAADPRAWQVQVLVMGEHYADCAESPPPPLDGPVFADGAVRFVSRDRAPYGCSGDPDLVLRPEGDLVRVTQCDLSFLARPHDALRDRYARAESAWVAAEIARLGLPKGASPTSVHHAGADYRCFPATPMDGTSRGPLLGCERLGGPDVWFDEHGEPGACTLHNMCGYRGIWLEKR